MGGVHNEIQISVYKGTVHYIRIIKSIPDNLWVLKSSKDIKFAFDKVLDVQIPFDLLDVTSGDNMEFVFAIAGIGLSDMFIPNEMLLNIKRI